MPPVFKLCRAGELAHSVSSSLPPHILVATASERIKEMCLEIKKMCSYSNKCAHTEFQLLIKGKIVKKYFIFIFCFKTQMYLSC